MDKLNITLGIALKNEHSAEQAQLSILLIFSWFSRMAVSSVH